MAVEYVGSTHRRGSIDMETATAVVITPEKLSRRRHAKTVQNNDNKQQHNNRCFASCLLYIFFGICLFLWIVLQISMAKIHFKQISHDDTISQYNTTQVMSNDNKSEHLGTSFSEHMTLSYTLFVNTIHNITSFICNNLRIIISTSNYTDTNSTEEDYVYIFYILLGINLLTMLPSLYRYFSSRIRRTSYLRDEDRLIQDKDKQINDTQKDQQHITHNKLLQVYLPAYLFATCADWLQGPYKYALYSSYGYTQRDIAHLFVAGYGSGMILGSIVGGLADVYGRKRLCLCYCLSYTCSVLTKHCKHFHVLLLGRVGGGIATSLLFSVFESWLIGAHRERGLDDEKYLSKSLSISMYGSSLVAIGSGVLANIVVSNSGKMRPLYGNESSIYYGGYISAFDACLIPLLLCATLVTFKWDENYGEASTPELKKELTSSSNGHDDGVTTREYSEGFLKKHSSLVFEDGEEYKLIANDEVDTSRSKIGGAFSALLSGCSTVWNTPTILICCIVGSVFEGTMYIFIFLWSPALTSLQEQVDLSNGRLVEGAEKEDSELPFGWIFSSFMVCCMLGSIAFSRLSTAGVSASKSLVGILALSSISCIAMASTTSNVTSSALSPQYMGMLIYEFCIGLYFPAIGTLKATIVPETERSAIYNAFRLPLNLIVLGWLVGDFTMQNTFFAIALLLMGICLLQIRLVMSNGDSHQVHQHKI